jgi:hypothetical protein
MENIPKSVQCREKSYCLNNFYYFFLEGKDTIKVSFFISKIYIGHK